MRRLIALMVLITWSGLAVAEKQAFACQSLASAGLKWEGGRWISTRFVSEPPFMLVMIGGNFTRESAAAALRTSNLAGVHCRNVGLEISCTDASGGFLFYNPETALGGVAQLLGATLTGSERDTLAVEPFTCQKF